MMGISTLEITALLLAFGIGMFVALAVLRPTPTVVIQNQPVAESGYLGLIFALVMLILIWLALVTMVL